MTGFVSAAVTERSASPALQRWLPRLLLVAALVVLPLYAAKVYKKDDYTDFSVYYLASSRATSGALGEVYNLGDGASPYRYVPPMVLVFRPFVALDLRSARVAWYFLQFAFFALGFALIHRALRAARAGPSLAITCFSAFFILRFCLDCFTIGQVSSLMFLGFALALHGWSVRRPFLAGFGLFIPTLFKIGPGVGYLFLAASRRRDRWPALWAPIVGFAAINFALWAWLLAQPGVAGHPGAATTAFIDLWRGWAHVVAMDSTYFDASHYGSQSLKSALLRLANSGWLSHPLAGAIHLALVVAGVLAAAAFWSLRKPRTIRGRGLFLSSAIFPYLWFMPETFKYSLTPLAIPVAFLLARPRTRSGSTHPSRLTRLALGFGFATMSIAGLDVVGETLFFASQRASLPFVATVLIGAAVIEQAWRESLPTRLGRFIASLLRAPGLGPWPRDPEPASLDVTVLVPVPQSRFVTLAPALAERTLQDLARALAATGRSAEIVLVPYGDRLSLAHPLHATVARFAAAAPDRRLLPPPAAAAAGRASALRWGFLHARGRLIATAQLEQPVDPDFFSNALARLGQADAPSLVRANRRHPRTRFRVPVRVLRLVYGRHRLGLAFNRLVRLLLPIDATDTQSGSLVMTRALATAAFSVQSSPDFLFEIELSLTARAHGLGEASLPVRLYLHDEKSPGRMLEETLSILRGLLPMARRYRRGCYHPLPARLEAITADDWGLSPGVNDGILALARDGVIRRVSVMAGLPHATTRLTELALLPGVEVGLHFNLTHGRFDDASGLIRHGSAGSLLIRWLRAPRAARAETVRLELARQLSALQAAGARARYIDGHQHTHLIPGVLDAIAPELRARGITRVRIPYDRALLTTAKAPVSLLALWAARRARALGFESLACFYPQPAHLRDHGLLRARLRREPHAEVITHPALHDDVGAQEYPDAYTTGRLTEYLALRMLRAP